jgi:hypothetical protein
MLRDIFIAAHAAAGVVALVAGVVALRGGRLLNLHAWSTGGMTLFLLLAVGAEWDAIDTTARVPFAAFGVLAVIMVRLSVMARPIRPAHGVRPSPRYLDYVGFNVVALFDAFVVIAVLDIGAPIWLVAGSGVAIGVAGHLLLRWAKHTLTAAAWPIGQFTR